MIRISREKTAPDFPVLLRLMGSDRVSNRETKAGVSMIALHCCKIVEAARCHGDRYYQRVSETPDWTGPAWYMPPGLNTDVTTAIKKAGVKVPVSVVGKIANRRWLRKSWRGGKRIFISMARALICDPYWPKKYRKANWTIFAPVFTINAVWKMSSSNYSMSCTTNRWSA